MYNRLSILVFSLMAANMAVAQNDASVQVRFLAQVLPDGLGTVVMASGEEIGEPFTLPTLNLSKHLEPPARTFALKAGEGQLLGTVALPENGRDFIVLLVVGKGAGYIPIIIDSSDAGFQVGDVYAYNSSSHTIQGKVGSLGFMIPAGKSRIITPAGAIEGRYYDVAFGLRNEADKSVRVISTSRWPVTKVRRSYLFFFDEPQNDTVTYRAVDEYMPSQ